MEKSEQLTVMDYKKIATELPREEYICGLKVPLASEVETMSGLLLLAYADMTALLSVPDKFRIQMSYSWVKVDKYAEKAGCEACLAGSVMLRELPFDSKDLEYMHADQFAGTEFKIGRFEPYDALLALDDIRQHNYALAFAKLSIEISPKKLDKLNHFRFEYLRSFTLRETEETPVLEKYLPELIWELRSMGC